MMTEYLVQSFCDVPKSPLLYKECLVKTETKAREIMENLIYDGFIESKRVGSGTSYFGKIFKVTEKSTRYGFLRRYELIVQTKGCRFVDDYKFRIY